MRSARKPRARSDSGASSASLPQPFQRRPIRPARAACARTGEQPLPMPLGSCLVVDAGALRKHEAVLQPGYHSMRCRVPARSRGLQLGDIGRRCPLVRFGAGKVALAPNSSAMRCGESGLSVTMLAPWMDAMSDTIGECARPPTSRRARSCSTRRRRFARRRLGLRVDKAQHGLGIPLALWRRRALPSARTWAPSPPRCARHRIARRGSTVRQHHVVADRRETARHVMQLLALAGRVHVEQHHRERATLVGWTTKVFITPSAVGMSR